MITFRLLVLKYRYLQRFIVFQNVRIFLVITVNMCYFDQKETNVEGLIERSMMKKTILVV